MRDITVILPIHSVKGDTMEWFKKAIESIDRQIVKPEKVLIIRCTCPDVAAEVENFFKENKFSFQIDVVENTNTKDFPTQINEAIKLVKTEYFSILELDDEYGKIWFKNVKEYIEAYPDVNAFLPIIIETDVQGKFVGSTNEAVWASNFSDLMGYLDNDALLEYQNFNISGGVFKTDLVHKFGGLKKNIKLTFVYEFLLRLTYNDAKIMTIPKYGYRHTNMRPNSYFFELQRKDGDQYLEPKEAEFWIETARKEFYWNKDREIIYETT